MASGGFAVGDRVRDGQGEAGVVLGSSDGLLDVAFPSGRRSVDPEELSPLELDPAEKLLAGQLSPTEHYSHYIQATFLRHAYRYDPLAGLSNARVEPMPHQVFAAHRVTSKPWPRMILADEVGLGKTIEAGLVIKELVARRMVDRVLVVSPANLVDQWESELRLKFNLEFEVIDTQRLKKYGGTGKNPWPKSARPLSRCPSQPRALPRLLRRLGISLWLMKHTAYDDANRVASGMRRRPTDWSKSSRTVTTHPAFCC